MAAMAKKPYIVSTVVSRLKKGQRIVVYANRIEVVEHLFEAILKGMGVKWEDESKAPQAESARPAQSATTSIVDVGDLDLIFPGDDDNPAEDLAVSFGETDLKETIAASLDYRALAAARAGFWASCIHSPDDAYRHNGACSKKGPVISEYRDLPLGIGALIVGSRDSIGRGINGLQETDLAIYAQLGSSPGPLLQAIYRHERPKHRMGHVATEFQILIAEGTVDERVEDETLRLGQAAASVAPTEGLAGVLTALAATAMLDVEELAARFDGPADEAQEGSGP